MTCQNTTAGCIGVGLEVKSSLRAARFPHIFKEVGESLIGLSLAGIFHTGVEVHSEEYAFGGKSTHREELR